MTNLLRPGVLLCGALTLALVGGAVAGSTATTRPADAPDRPSVATPADASDRPGPGSRVGRWSVVPAGLRHYAVRWTSPSTLPVIDAQPEIVVEGATVGPTEFSSDGRTVSAIVESATPPSIPDLDVSLSGQALDDASRSPEVAAAPSPRPPATLELTEDPGTARQASASG